MTKEQTQMIVGLIARAYPKHYANMTAQEKWEVVALYYDYFKDAPFELMQKIIKEYVGSNKFPPSIADLVERVEKVVGAEEEYTVESCIAESLRALRGDIRFENLSEPSKIYWGSQKDIDIMGYSETAEHTVVRGQMMKRLPSIIQNLKVRKSTEAVRIEMGDIKELPIGFDENGRIVKALKE